MRDSEETSTHNFLIYWTISVKFGIADPPRNDNEQIPRFAQNGAVKNTLYIFFFWRFADRASQYIYLSI